MAHFSARIASNNMTLNQPYDDAIASSVWLLTSGVGLAVNALAAVCLLRVKSMHNQFAILCVSLAVADCGVLAIFLFWVTPVTFFQKDEWAVSLLGRKIGQIGLLCWFACLYGTLAITVNRFIAIAYYQQYQHLCSMGNTRKVIICTWCVALCHSLLYFYPGCDFVYDTNAYYWYYTDSPCQRVSLLMDLGYGIAFIALIFIINLGTGTRIRAYNQQIARSGLINEHDATKNRERERRFFVQAIINAAIFELMLICCHIVSRFCETKWTIFLSTSFVWLISHASNGFILLAFNPELRNETKAFLCCSSDTPIVSRERQINDAHHKLALRAPELNQEIPGVVAEE